MEVEGESRQKAAGRRSVLWSDRERAERQKRWEEVGGTKCTER